MATYTYKFEDPTPNPFKHGFIGEVEVHCAPNSTLNAVKATLASGNATLNLSLGSQVQADIDQDDVGIDGMTWMMRAEDLTASKSDGDAVDIWYSALANENNHSYRQQTSSNQPSYYEDQDGLGYNAASSNTNPSVYFNGFASTLPHYGGSADIAYTDSWTLVTAIGKKNSGFYRAMLGSISTGSAQALYGDWGRHRTRQGVIKGSTKEYMHSGNLLDHDQIRVLTVDYTSSSGRVTLNEWINSTQKYTNQSFAGGTMGAAPWTFDMLGAAQYVAGTYTYYVRFSGGISEMWLINGVVTTAQRELIEGVLAHKYGSSSLLPTSHTYKSTSPINSKPSMINAQDLELTSSQQTVKASMNQNLASGAEKLRVYMPASQLPGDLTLELDVT